MKILPDWFTNVCTQIQIDKSMSYYVVYNFCEKTHLYTRERDNNDPENAPYHHRQQRANAPHLSAFLLSARNAAKRGLFPGQI